MITPAPRDPPELDGTLWRDFPHVDVAFDIGANCGQTLPRIRDLSAVTFAFEPAEESFEYLTVHFGGIPFVYLVPFAVSAETGTIELMAAPSKIDTGQLVTHGTAGMEWSEDEMANGIIRSVQSVSIDDFCAENDVEPGFLKIDVEGHEGEVLRGAVETIEAFRPYMLIEIHSEQLGESITEQLSPLYDLEIVRHPHYPVGSAFWRTHFWLRCLPKVPV